MTFPSLIMATLRTLGRLGARGVVGGGAGLASIVKSGERGVPLNFLD